MEQVQGQPGQLSKTLSEIVKRKKKGWRNTSVAVCAGFTYETLDPTQCYHYNYNIYQKFKNIIFSCFKKDLEKFQDLLS